MKRTNRARRVTEKTEKRKHKRRSALRGAVAIRPGLRKSIPRKARPGYRLLDISQGGLCVASRGRPSALRAGNPVSCAVKIKAHRTLRYKFSGRVAWTKPWEKKSSTILGVEFHKPSKAARWAITELCKHRPKDWGIVVL